MFQNWTQIWCGLIQFVLCCSCSCHSDHMFNVKFMSYNVSLTSDNNKRSNNDLLQFTWFVDNWYHYLSQYNCALPDHCAAPLYCIILSGMYGPFRSIHDLWKESITHQLSINYSFNHQLEIEIQELVQLRLA